MASSSSKKRKSKLIYDSDKFVSEEAQSRYHESVVKRIPIAERGLCVSGVSWPAIQNNIYARKWDEFCKQPKAAVVPIVREFYANAPEHNNRKVFVRGKWVSFSGRAINQFFKTPDIDKDDYNAFIAKPIDYQELLQRIAVPGTQWKMREDKPITLRSIGLTKECKAWYYFLGARLMPVRHFSDITRDRAVLLYSLVSEQSLDLGKFLSSNIMLCCKHSSMSLFYPSLITALCVAAGVEYGPNEEFLAPMAAITDTKVTAMKGVDRLEPTVPASSGRPLSGRPLTIAERMESLEGRVADQAMRFEQFTDYQIACNDSLGEMMRQLALGMAADMSQFPFMPVYPGRDQGEEPGSSQAEGLGVDVEGDDEGEEEDEDM